MTALQERLTGIRVIQSFGREEDQLAGYERRSRAQIHAWQHASYVNIRFFPAIAIAQAVATATVLVAGAWLYRRGDVSTGVLAAFVLYLASLFDPVARLGDWFSEFQSGRAALSKIVGLLETPVDVTEPAEPVALPERGSLVAERVSYSYSAGHPLLHEVSLTVRTGEQRSWPWSGRPARASRPWRSSSCGPTTPMRARCRSAASTCATPASRSCAAGSSSCRRRGTSSRARSPTTCGSRGPTPRTTTSSAPSRRSGRSSGSRCSRAASPPTSRPAASGSPPENGSSSRSRGSRWPIRRWSSWTRPPRASTRPRKRPSSAR